ncbi:MAG: hypothetical protein JO317_02440 [Verrucomicrobiae bacterium]|nr:hypothetical protein [Verrucomicrobiae bacterium]
MQQVEGLLEQAERAQKRGELDDPGFIAECQDVRRQLEERNTRMRGRADSREFVVYAESQEIAREYLKEAQATRELYEQIFPRARFLPSTPAQILIYTSLRDYVKYEQVFDPMASLTDGHTLPSRGSKLRLMRQGPRKFAVESVVVSSNKQYRLATYRQVVPYVFAHEVSHIMTYEMVNPSSSSLQDARPNTFLNEGLAEYFAARLHPKTLQERVQPLRQTFGIGEDPPLDMELPEADLDAYLGMSSYPRGEKLFELYSEGTLFVSWLMQLPDGPNLVGTLLTTPSGQFETLMKQYQREHGLNPTGWAQYQAFRRDILLARGPQPPDSAKALPGARATNAVTAVTSSPPAASTPAH